MNRLAPGFVLTSRYRLEHLVAAGGMGQVWAARDEILGRRVALKVMHPSTLEQRALVQRFRAEARVAARLSHPNIVEIFDFGEHDGLEYLVMEFVEGPTLAGLLAGRGALDAEAVRGFLVQLAGALARAHENGIVHRDLKPSNVLVTADGIAKLMDFGIAKDVEGVSQTLTGEVLGTTYYISPEQALGEPVTPRSDLYSLGVLGHELLTGIKPFDRGTPVATALAHLEQPPPPLPPSVPADLAAVIAACLAKSPGERPPSARSIATLLAPAASFLAPPVELDGVPAAGAPPLPFDGTADLPATERWVPTAAQRG